MKPNWANRLLYVVALAALLGTSCASNIKPPRNARVIEREMLTTGYCKCGKCCNWRHTWLGRTVIASGPARGDRKHVGVTASGRKARPGTIAADTSIYPFGTVMHVPGYGYGRVEDRGGAITGQHIDLFFKSHKAATRWGRQTLPVRVYLPR